jgi:beta-propeller repeat-containing protein
MTKKFLLPMIFILCITIIGFSGNNDMTSVTGTNQLNSEAQKIQLAKETGINVSSIPLYFIPNKGQVNARAFFYSNTSRYTLWATKDGLIFDSSDLTKGQRNITKVNFVNANSDAFVAAQDISNHRVNYFKGHRSNWKTDIKTSRAIQYTNVYNKIDLKIYGIEKEVEYDWIVKPGGNPKNICFEISDATSTSLDKNGNLNIETNSGTLSHRKPFSYQIIDGQQVEVKSSFKKVSKNVYAFNVANYDKTRNLLIDPVVLLYSSYVGGSANSEYINGFTSDSSGKIYIVGDTTSKPFPTKDAYDDWIPTNGNYDAFITVMDTTESGASSLHYSSYIGGDGVDSGFDVEVDSSGNIYVTGATWTGLLGSQEKFPTSTEYGVLGGYDAFVLKLDPSLVGSAQLKYSYIIGGSGEERSKGLAVKNVSGVDKLYLTGFTGSTNFPVTTNAYQTTKNGTYDVFFLQVDSNGLQYATYLGGNTNGDTDRSDRQFISLGGDSLVFIAGRVRETDFPTTTGAHDSTRAGTFDGYISAFDMSTETLVYSTYYGGTDDDQIWGIWVNSSNEVYIAGKTGSNSSTSFPITTNAYQTTRYGYDTFVTQMDYNTTLKTMTINYSTYLGGSSTDQARYITVDDSGYVYVAGQTQSTNHPLQNAYQSTLGGAIDAYVSVIDITAGTSGLLFSTYLGGSSNDWGCLAGVDSSGNILLGGVSQSTNFPTYNAYQTSKLGTYDAFASSFSTN